MRVVKSWDIYRKPPEDYCAQTVVGGCCTVLAAAAMAVLLVMELHAFLTPTVTMHTMVDLARDTDIQVNLNVTLPNVPCAMLGVDVQDSAGTHLLNVSNTLKYTQFDRSGFPKPSSTVNLTLSAIHTALKDHDYCRIEGQLMVGTVPGNFHIGTHSMFGAVIGLYPSDVDRMRFEHTINHLSFGRKTGERNGGSAGLESIFSPYDNLQVNFPDNHTVYSYDYFIKIIPTQFLDESTQAIQTSYQFSLNHQLKPAGTYIGAIYFRYDVDCVTVVYTNKEKRISQLLIHLCAILGGVFAAVGIGNSIVFEAVKAVFGR